MGVVQNEQILSLERDYRTKTLLMLQNPRTWAVWSVLAATLANVLREAVQRASIIHGTFCLHCAPCMCCSFLLFVAALFIIQVLSTCSDTALFDTSPQPSMVLCKELELTWKGLGRHPSRCFAECRHARKYDQYLSLDVVQIDEYVCNIL